ncbi:energy transducer TonB [Chitinophaga nivalis]|uniref:TonB family protein n=1 Tax=Chitinophaga nivalis TaxID=2991709 RepID=A0ABT3IED0_9BACT|nr:energy transducer TonB [Chitinophaga nivalis]MCW3467998.1 TonB family protein [Chitinophaga nivalis]MCW3482311.1 TonB family protein [Chitinophaga nivalis]
MDSTTLRRNDFLDILFEGRNKDYGAYELRSRYDKRVRNAIMGTASIVLVIIGGYVLNNKLMAAENTMRPVFIVDKIIQLDDIKTPEPEPVLPPPPQTAALPPVQAPTIDFAKPVVTADENVSPDEEPPKMKDVVGKAIGFENTEGDINGVENGDLAVHGGHDVVTAPVTKVDDTRPVTFVEIMPEFPGGELELGKYLGRNTRYPGMAQENGIGGTVFVQFVVNRDGSITDVKTTGQVKGGGLEEEAIRVVRSMPKWRPGRQNGQNVAVFFNLPIRFNLQGE